MKIVHPSGQSYDLFPGTDLELTRYNPFFNDLGEQSIPISLPSSPRNLTLLDHPGRIDNVKKPMSRIDTLISAGTYSARARQAILSAQNKGTIETSFYLNEGAFNEKTKDLSLLDVFKDKFIQFANVDSAIAFTHSLMSQSDDRFSCFMVFTDNRMLNYIDPEDASRFYYAVDRDETVDEKPVHIPRGMFITPFIKVRHVLEEIAAHLGYSLESSFMDLSPFKDMVFLNNNVDTIFTGSINYIDIVPDVTVEEFFSILRKFNVEIITNETHKKLKLVSFNDILGSTGEDLSKQLVGDITVAYHNNYKQLSLTSELLNIPESSLVEGSSYSGSEINMVNEFTSLPELLNNFPMARAAVDGSVYRIGYKGDKQISERLGSLHCNYSSGDDLPVEEKIFPDVLTEIFKSLFVTKLGSTLIYNDILLPYVGGDRALRSKLVFEDEESQSEDTKSPNHQKLKAILCLYYYDAALGLNVGTIHNYSLAGQKLWDYTIAYNGVDGIYEKFWRLYEDLLRNAFLEVRGDFLLSETQKMMLSSHKKVIVESQALIPSQIKYVPGKNIPQECMFLSTKLQEPLSHARSQQEYFPELLYKWSLKTQRSFSLSPPANTFEVIKFKRQPVAFFPNHPTAAQYMAGGPNFSMQHEVEYGYTNLFTYTKVGEGVITVWLEAVLNN